MSWTKKTLFYGITLLSMLILVELASFVISKTIITDVRSDSSQIFSGVTVKNDAELGWVAHNGKPRPSSIYTPSVQQNDACIFVFGDSFSHSEEVSDEEAWANLLEQKAGCPVANYGVGGYGTDQAYLLMVRVLPDRSSMKSDRNSLVLFGVYQEMLNRNMAGSWLFMGWADWKSSLRPYYEFASNGRELILNSPPHSVDVESIKMHHSSDRYYQLYKIDFPYTLSILKNLYYRANKEAFNRVALEPEGLAYTTEEVVLKQTSLMKIVVNVASARGYKVGFVYYPTPEDAYNNVKQYESFLYALPGGLKSSEHVFTIDLLLKLYDGSRLEGRALRAPEAHYDGVGNAIIANAIYEEIAGNLGER